MNSQEELEKLLDALRIEQEEDRKQYREKVLLSPIAERKRAGVTWYPIVIKESYYGVGERLILEIERPNDMELSHQFTSGKVASLFSNYHNEGSENPAISGVVMNAGLNNLRLTLFVDELPEWAHSGKLGLDLMFDEASYKEMEQSVYKVMKASSGRLERIREILLGHEEASFNDSIKEVKVDGLNEFQNKALNNVLKAEDVAIIHGPPGTGKTTTLVQTIRQTLQDEEQVLVCAPSNAAVDLLTEKLHEAGIPVLRFGNPARISEELMMHSLDYKITSHKDYKQIKELKKRAVEYRTMALKYKRNFGKEEREQRKMILDEARKIQNDAFAIEKYIVDDVLTHCKVYTATLVGSENQYLKDKKFKTIFIDEAAQALEPACWIPIARAERVVLAGDHCQLPPTVKSAEAAKKGLSVTLFEKTIQRQKVDVMLQTQYRMNEHIMKFSSKEFYHNGLVADAAVKDRVLGMGAEVLEQALTFIDTAGCGFEEIEDKESRSLYNPEEANLMLKYFQLLMEGMKEGKVEMNKLKVGVISPYKAQVMHLKARFAELLAETPIPFTVSINTVDGFQGQERDVIFISLVRSNDNGEIGFLSDIRRMNVALTRAKKKLVVIGDSATLSQHKFYKDFLDYVETINAYKSGWEFIY